MSRRALRSVVFYAAMVLISKSQTSFLPASLATQVGHNSESFLFAIIIAVEIQFIRPRLMASSRRWVIAGAGAIAFFAVGYYLIHSGWIPTIVTLNEPVIAGGFMLVYLMLPRPLKAAPYISLGILAFIVIFFNTGFVFDQAESLVPFLIAPLALDVFDRTILEPEHGDHPLRRAVWIVCLVAVAVAFMALAHWARQDLQGPIRLGIDYGQRAAEAYWGWILIHLYFSYWLGRTWRSGRTAVPLDLGTEA